MVAEAYSEATVARLRDAALALLPPGRAFSRRLDSMIAKVLEGLVTELARVHAETLVVLAHVSPRRATREDLLSAWEEAIAETNPTGTIAERAQHVADVIRGARAITFAAFAAIAAEHGYVLEDIHAEVAFFRAGESAAGDPVPGEQWAYALVGQVTGDDDEAALEALTADWAARITRAHVLLRARVGAGATFVMAGADPVYSGPDPVVL